MRRQFATLEGTK